MTTDIKIAKIRIDGNTQPRTKINTDVVSEYATAFEMNESLPPVDVFHDGKEYWLADGFHRFHGASKAGRKEITCNVHKGTQREAILFSVGANASHGLRRTNEDKRAAVLTLLNDEEWGKWSAREIARACAVSQPFVSELRILSDNVITEKPARVKYTTKHGTESTQPSAKKAKPKEAENPEEKPDAGIPASDTEPSENRESGYSPGFDPTKFDPEMMVSAEEADSEPTGDIPKHLVPILEDRKQYKSLQREVSLLMGKVIALVVKPIGSYIQHQEAERNVKQLQANLKAWGFGENCPTCKNKPDTKCLKCKGRGWIAQGQMGQLSDLDKEWLAKNGVSK